MPTLQFDGFTFTGTAAECAEMAAQFNARKIEPSAAQPAPSATIKDAPTLNPQAAWPFPTKGAAAQPSNPQRRDRKLDEYATTFLHAIARHNSSGGVTGEELMPLLGVVHPKGIGSRIALINGVVSNLGLKPEDVYRKHRDAGGARHWRSGPKMNHALRALEAQTKGGEKDQS